MKSRLAATMAALLLIGAVCFAARDKKGLDSTQRYQVSTLAKSFLRLINRGEYDQCRSLMADNLVGTMSTNRLMKTFDPIRESMGDFSHFKTVGLEKVIMEGKDYALCRLKGVYEKGSLNLSVLVNPDMEIEGVYVK